MIHPDTDYIADTWRAASEPVISIRSVSWPQLKDFNDYLNDLYKVSPGSDEPSKLVKRGYDLLKDITSAPVAPSNPAMKINNFVECCQVFADKHPNHSLSDPLLQLACAALDLLEERSPLLDAVLDELSNYGLSKNKHPEAVIVVYHEKLIEPTKEFLDEEKFIAAVKTPVQLKSECHHYKGIVVIGNIATTYKSLWKDAQRAAREFGWLVTAPPADKVCIINSRGENLDLNESWLLSGDRHPHLPAAILITQPEPIIRINLPDPPPRTIKPTAYSDEGIDAHLVRLSSGHIVYFADDQGPTPKRIVVDETSDSTEDCDVEKLHKGNLLLLQASGADSDEIEHRAANILQEKYNWVDIDIEQAEQDRKQLKDALRQVIDQFGEEELCQRLCNSGLSTDYSKQLLYNVPKSRYICPRERGFVPLLTAIDAIGLLSCKDRLQRLQTAHQQAGKEIRKELDCLLTKDYNWLDDVGAEGFARVDGDRLGILLIEVVACVDDRTYSVPLNHLGRAIEADTGKMYKPILGGGE